MSDHSITTRDVAVLRDILQLSCPTRPEDQAGRTFDVLELIDGLLGSDFVSFQVMDSRHRVRPYLQHLEEGDRVTMAADEIAASDEQEGLAGLETFWHEWWTSPCSLPERTGKPVVVSLQSFYGQRTWLTSRLHGEYLACEDELLLGYPIAPG